MVNVNQSHPSSSSPSGSSVRRDVARRDPRTVAGRAKAGQLDEPDHARPMAGPRGEQLEHPFVARASRAGEREPNDVRQVGAHPSGRIGESPNDAPNNLFPCVTQFAVGRRPELKVFGTDYPTPDGSGVRDYLHVCDLAAGHVAALREIGNLKGAVAINLGTGTGYSVLEVIAMFEEVSGRKIPARYGDRRPGDIASCYADPTRAGALLNWQARQTLRAMCEDSWRWQTENPAGYVQSGGV